jgi:hypothetical protein
MAKLLSGTRIYGTANVDTSVTIGNSTVNSALTTGALSINAITIANSSTLGVTGFIANSTNISITGFIGNSTGVYTGVINSTSINSASHTIGTTLVANTLGVYHTGVVNAATLSVGTSFIANTAGAYHTGAVNCFSINSASHTVGSTFIANLTVLTFTPNTFNLGSVSKAAAGYVWLPNGVLKQWGTATANNTVGNVTFPVAFPTACQSVTLGVVGSANVAYHAAAANSTVAQIRTASTTTAISVYWQAIGY